MNLFLHLPRQRFKLFLSRLTESIAASPLLEANKKRPTLPLALRGWIGMVEAVSLGWIEMADKNRPSLVQVRDMLSGTLIGILGLGS